MRYLFLFSLFFMFACSPSLPKNTDIGDFTLIAEYPHSTNSFTEGLFWHDGKLFESTAGMAEYPKTKSEFGILNLATGDIESKVQFDEKKYFCEGITLLNDKIYQATYKHQKMFVFDTKTWKKIGEFTYANTEGWGLTNDGKNIIMSDGSDMLTFFDPEKLKVTKTLKVTKENLPIKNINELEYVDGYIYANIWLTNRIIKIDANTGEIAREFDLSKLTQKTKNQFPNALEMNGIAYHHKKKTFWVTGKFWGRIYEIELF
ncbi:glutamine cyclotransferase [Candidatus Gracilibacteria bacterium]|nr:MAG: glutamine cyclotransferase [Candidatus Gracilibacteria bacterium]